VPLFSRPSAFKDLEKYTAPGIDSFKLLGEFSLVTTGDHFDPDSQGAKLIFSQAAVLYSATVPPGVFLQQGSAKRPMWRFVLHRNDPDIPGAEGWRGGKLSHTLAGVIGPLNRIKYSLKGEGTPFVVTVGFGGVPGITKLRQTIRVGDHCATDLLSCVATPFGKYKCYPLLPP